MSLEGEDDLPPVTGVEDAPAPPSDVEVIARELGWKPEAEWKGKPPEGGFASAADYIRSQRDRAKNVEKEMKKLRSETDKRIKRMEDQTAKQREREIAEIHEEYDWWIRDAIKKGDDSREKALIKERDGKVKQAEAVVEKEEDQPDEPATEEEWVEQFQPAYPELQKRFYADGHSWVLDEDADPDAMRIVLDFVDSGVPFAEALEKAGKALRKAYADRYEEDEDMDEEPEEKPAKKRVPVLASGAKAGGSGVSAASRLSPAQRTIGAKFVKDGLFGSLEEYAEERLKLG